VYSRVWKAGPRDLLNIQISDTLQSFYHPYCPIQWGNATSEQNCWLGDEKVALPDVDTTNPTVIAKYGDWIQDLVKQYNIDGLRIDGEYRNSCRLLMYSNVNSTSSGQVCILLTPLRTTD
jgi:hypothetical protein